MKINRIEFYFTITVDDDVPRKVVDEISFEIEQELKDDFIEAEKALQLQVDLMVMDWRIRQEEELINRIVKFCNTGE